MTARGTSTTNANAVESDRRVVQRCAAVIGLTGIALIHLIDVPSKLDEVPYVGLMFMGLIATSLLIAALLIRADDPRAWLAGGTLAGLTILGYVMSRTAGLPGDGGGDIGNWTEPLGLCSLLIEGAVVYLCINRLSLRART